VETAVEAGLGHHDRLPVFMTRQEVAELLRVTLPTVDRMVRQGFLPEPIRLGGQVVRFRGPAIQAKLDI